METRGQEVHLDKDEARAGSTPRIVRYVLLISITLAIIALSAIWIVGALNSSRNSEGMDHTPRVAQDGNGQTAGR